MKAQKISEPLGHMGRPRAPGWLPLEVEWAWACIAHHRLKGGWQASKMNLPHRYYKLVGSMHTKLLLINSEPAKRHYKNRKIIKSFHYNKLYPSGKASTRRLKLQKRFWGPQGGNDDDEVMRCGNYYRWLTLARAVLLREQDIELLYLSWINN